MILTDRISLLEILNLEFPGGSGVEVGVAGGHFARQILASWPTIGRLYLIDAWKHFDEAKFANGYVDGYNLDDKTQEERYRDVMEYFAPIPCVHIIRSESVAAARKAQKRVLTFDFIYIDANHCYQAVKEDIAAWWPLLNNNGIMAGHDYYNKGQYFEVKKAVDEFAEENGLTVHVTTETNSRPSAIYGASWEGPSWVIKKP